MKGEPEALEKRKQIDRAGGKRGERNRRLQENLFAIIS